MQWHQSVRYGCSTPLIMEPGCYLCSGSWCEFVSLSVSVWLFQMLKWIISQKLLNVQWKVVTETPVSDFQLFFFFFPPHLYWNQDVLSLFNRFQFWQPKWIFLQNKSENDQKRHGRCSEILFSRLFVCQMKYLSQRAGSLTCAYRMSVNYLVWVLHWFCNTGCPELTLYIWCSALYSNFVMVNKCIRQHFHIVNIWVCDESPTCIRSDLCSCVTTLALYICCDS